MYGNVWERFTSERVCVCVLCYNYPTGIKKGAHKHTRTARLHRIRRDDRRVSARPTSSTVVDSRDRAQVSPFSIHRRREFCTHCACTFASRTCTRTRRHNAHAHTHALSNTHTRMHTHAHSHTHTIWRRVYVWDITVLKRV